MFEFLTILSRIETAFGPGRRLCCLRRDYRRYIQRISVYPCTQGTVFKYFDLVMPSIYPCQGLGRIGCYLAMLLRTQVDNPMSCLQIQRSRQTDAAASDQLISSGLNFLHCIVLLWFARRAKAPGQVSALYLICYSAGGLCLNISEEI